MNSTLRRPDGTERTHGEFDLPTISAFVKAMHEAGEFNTADIPVEKLFSNSLVKQFAEFDVSAVREQARAQAAQ